MVVLALETVTRGGSIALWRDGACEAVAGERGETHGARLPGEVTDWLRARGLNLADVDLLAVVVGPGSFTGLRVGIAAVQGFAHARHMPVAGISTLDALAACWRLEHRAAALVVPCLDGQRGEVFAAAIDVATPDLDLNACARVIPPVVATPDELGRRVQAVAAGRRVVLVGDGALRYADVLGRHLPEAEIGREPYPIAGGAAWLAAAHPERGGTPHAVRPFYLRRTDAELARDRRAAAREVLTADQCSVRRVSSSEDLGAVQSLQQSAFTNPWGADAIRWELENTDVARLYALSSPEGVLLAYCACWVVFDELHINSLAVDPAWRRRGLARHLLRHVLAEAVGAGARSATLEVRRSNVPARLLYEGLGFQVEATRRDYYQDPREDALILWNRAL